MCHTYAISVWKDLENVNCFSGYHQLLTHSYRQAISYYYFYLFFFVIQWHLFRHRKLPLVFYMNESKMNIISNNFPLLVVLFGRLVSPFTQFHFINQNNITSSTYRFTFWILLLCFFSLFSPLNSFDPI